ncbi:MAG: hypothetical protein LBI19_05290, partial [Oscillospiraceae bacterium]|nr:hypothetical protein [Oscillospiraceae bacterium]
ESKMSLTELTELINSNMTLAEKGAKLREVYGNVLADEALETTIQSIQNGKYSIAEMTTELERRAELAKISPQEALTAFIETDPNRADVERSKALSAKFIPIQQKLRAGKELTPAEKSFIQEHYPEMYAQAMQIEQEVAQLKAQLRNSNSKEEANKIYMQTKMRVMGMAGKDNGLSFGLIPALDNAFRNM